MLIFLIIEAKNLSIRRGRRFYFLTRVPIFTSRKNSEKRSIRLHTNYFRIISNTTDESQENSKIIITAIKIVLSLESTKSN